jgi:UDP-GlcNAc:undecaprenyl-phosphate GlcNAc-1-phosphate transferase
VFIIYGGLLLIAVTLSRASFRIVGDFARRQRQSGRRVVIYGAGGGGPLVVRELVGDGGDEVRFVGFIDDDPRKAGIKVHGYPVLGGYSALTVLVKSASVDAVVLSMRRIAPERLNNLQVLCSEHQVRLTRLRIALETILDPDAQESTDQPARQRSSRS